MPSRKALSSDPEKRAISRRRGAAAAHADLRELFRREQEQWLENLHQLDAARQHFERLYNLAPIGLATFDASGVFREINDEGVDMIGGAREHIIGRPLLSFVVRSQAGAVLSHLRQCRAGAVSVRTELTLRNRREIRGEIELITRPLPGLGERLFCSTLGDMSLRRRSEEALRASERRYREIVETANEGICIVNIHNRISFVNRRMAAMLGSEIDALLGREMYDFLDKTAAAVARAGFAAGRPSRETAEVRLQRADGTFIWTTVSSARLRDTYGRFSGLLQMYTDITDGKEREAEHERLVGQLVSAQEGERRRIARELHDQIGQHIVGLSLGLKSLTDVLDDHDGRAALLARLTNLVEVMARDVHHVALELRPTALDDLGLPDALQHYAEDVGRRSGVEIDVHTDPDARLNATGETVFYRIAQEALTNAVKHARASRVSVLLERRDNLVQLIVEDDGVGFQADRLLRFGRLEQRLGLAGIMERASLINGEVHIESAPGRGTTLIVRVATGAREAPSNEEITSAAG
jgi:PAS domain S-box-containing protein